MDVGTKGTTKKLKSKKVSDSQGLIIIDHKL